MSFISRFNSFINNLRRPSDEVVEVIVSDAVDALYRYATGEDYESSDLLDFTDNDLIEGIELYGGDGATIRALRRYPDIFDRVLQVIIEQAVMEEHLAREEEEREEKREKARAERKLNRLPMTAPAA